MKKYHQLLLLIVSIISLSLFLIYRHQYNRLHYVLEVFNFFGTPCNFSDIEHSSSIIKEHDWGPEPIWQETDTGYIYSAFLTGTVEVKAIVLQRDTRNLPKNCYLWFEEEKKPVIGKLKVSRLLHDEKNALTAYFYVCSLRKIQNVPYAVSFSSKIKSDPESAKVLITNTLNQEVLYNTTVCVLPTAYAKKKLIEFISFHRLIGIDSFIFYNKEIPHRLTKLISNLSNILSLTTSFVPWNYPVNSGSLIRVIVESDCLLRSVGQTKFVMTLELNEYIVPTFALSLNAVTGNAKSDFKKLAVPVQRFCISNSNVNKPIALQNFQAIADASYNVVRYLFANSNISTAAGSIGKASASIHKYIRCNSEPFKTVSDKRLLTFSTDFLRTTLIQLLIHDKI